MSRLFREVKTHIIWLKYDIKYFIINCHYYVKLRLCKAKQLNTLFFVFDPNVAHPGLADRLKAIVSLYNKVKKSGYKMKIYFETPFCLFDYLNPKSCYRANLEELEYSLLDTKVINETNWHTLPSFSKDKQYHCYNYAGNSIPKIFPDTGYLWCDLFSELFEPSESLRTILGEVTPQKPFVSVHLRFVNALDSFENTFFNNSLSSECEKELLISKCKDGIKNIKNSNPEKALYVFSDSKRFLDSLGNMDVHTLDTRNIGHVGFCNSSHIHMKTFIDIFVMAKSEIIYRIKAHELYNYSCFALLASRIGNTQFVDIDLDAVK